MPEPIDLYEGILTTRAIRRYRDEPVRREEIEACLAAAMQAPSGGNTQPWQFLVVTDGATRHAIASVYLQAYERWEAAQIAAATQFRTEEEAEQFARGMAASRYLAENLGSAPVLVLFLMPRVSLAPLDDEGPVDIGTLYASMYPAVQNFMLAARAHGIGTVLTTVYYSRQQDLRDLLAIPDRYEIAALVPMGRPRGSFGRAPRRHHATATHWEAYGNRSRS